MSMSRNRAIATSNERYPWLGHLFKAYRRTDSLSEEVIRETEAQTGKKVACKKGCYQCCLKTDIPILEIEIAGISWYIKDRISVEVRQELIRNLKDLTPMSPCPFLINNLCSIYPVRPLGCRNFLVLGIPCKPNEDIAVTRRHDIVPGRPDKHRKQVVPEVLAAMDIPVAHRKELAEKGHLPKIAKDLHSLNWASFAKILESEESN